MNKNLLIAWVCTCCTLFCYAYYKVGSQFNISTSHSTVTELSSRPTSTELPRVKPTHPTPLSIVNFKEIRSFVREVYLSP